MPAKPMTAEERDAFFFALDQIDRMQFIDLVMERHPAVFDDVAARVERARKNLAATARRTAKQQGDNS